MNRQNQISHFGFCVQKKDNFISFFLIENNIILKIRYLNDKELKIFLSSIK